MWSPPVIASSSMSTKADVTSGGSTKRSPQSARATTSPMRRPTSGKYPGAEPRRAGFDVALGSGRRVRKAEGSEKRHVWSGRRWRVLEVGPGDAGFAKGCHLVEQPHRRFDKRHRQQCAGALAQP